MFGTTYRRYINTTLTANIWTNSNMQIDESLYLLQKIKKIQWILF